MQRDHVVERAVILNERVVHRRPIVFIFVSDVLSNNGSLTLDSRIHGGLPFG